MKRNSHRASLLPLSCLLIACGIIFDSQAWAADPAPSSAAAITVNASAASTSNSLGMTPAPAPRPAPATAATPAVAPLASATSAASPAPIPAYAPASVSMPGYAEKTRMIAAKKSAKPIYTPAVIPPVVAAASASASTSATAAASAPASTSSVIVAAPASMTAPPPVPLATSSSKPAKTPVLTSITSPVFGDYDRIWRISNFRNLSHDVVLQMQQQMGLVYYPLADWKHDYALPKQPLNDGILGPITAAWLQRMCFNFKIPLDESLGTRLPPAVTRLAEFAKKYPTETGILISPDFESWDNLEPEPQRGQDFQVRRQGSDAELLALVKRYLSRKKTKTKTSSSTYDVREPLTVYIYSLTADDLGILGGKDQVILALTALKDKEFDSVEALKAAVNQALGNRAQLYQHLWPLIEKQIVDVTGYQVNASKLAALKTQNVDDAILKALAKLNDNYFLDKSELELNVNDVLKDFPPEDIAAAFSKLSKQAEVLDGVQLNAQSLVNLTNDLKGDIYNASVPTGIVKMLKEIQDVQYPDVNLFNSAARAKILYSIGACKKNLPQDNQYVVSIRISDDELALLKDNLSKLEISLIKGSAQLDLTTTFDMLTKLRARQNTCTMEEYKSTIDAVAKIFDSYLANVVDSTARKNYPNSGLPIKWNGGKCGCALDHVTGVVYGFYPFWINQGKEQTMNFSMLSRIAYHALSMDNLGELKQSNDIAKSGQFTIDDGSAAPNEFIQTARNYNSKVDWVVQKSDWDEWSKYPAESKQAIFRRLANNIINLLHTPLTDKFSKAMPYLSLGFSRTPKRGDGVTIYFQDYPRDAESARLFNEFYGYLRHSMSGDRVAINILLSRPELANPDSAFSMANLIRLRKVEREIHGNKEEYNLDLKTYFLILLDEPSTDAKKLLRHDIDVESSISGAERVEFLQGVVPVVQFDNRNWQQLEADIAYMNYNFGGMGFWPLPVANLAKPAPTKPQSCMDSQQVLICLLDNFKMPGTESHLPSLIAREVCEYRWTLIILMNCWLIAIAVLAFLYFKYCNIQNFIRRYFLWMMIFVLLPPLIIFTLLLFYDPAWTGLSQGNLPFIIALAVIVLGTIGGYLYIQSQRELPQRERINQQKKKPRETS
ncbi:hypothetical protein ACO0K9_02465 [Undibacterium sp. Ji50W]